ncbi:MAG: hypothetical protein WCV79_04090 [Candidatus Paceibacterota bacterium]
MKTTKILTFVVSANVALALLALVASFGDGSGARPYMVASLIIAIVSVFYGIICIARGTPVEGLTYIAISYIPLAIVLPITLDEFGYDAIFYNSFGHYLYNSIFLSPLIVVPILIIIAKRLGRSSTI